MTRTQFLETLEEKLTFLTKEERESALNYYTEYLDDAQDERAALEQLGSPEEVAAQLLEGQSQSARPDKRRGGGWQIALWVLASPFLLILGSVALTLYLCFWVVGLCVALVLALLGAMPALVSAMLLLSGAGFVLAGVSVINLHVPTTLFFGGSGLAAAALGALLVWPAFKVLRRLFCWAGCVPRQFFRLSARLLKRRERV